MAGIEDRNAEPPTPVDSPLRMADALASPTYRALSTPDVARGDEAPELGLPVLGEPGRRVSLETLRGRPVALVFGSYT